MTYRVSFSTEGKFSQIFVRKNLNWNTHRTRAQPGDGGFSSRKILIWDPNFANDFLFFEQKHLQNENLKSDLKKFKSLNKAFY